VEFWVLFPNPQDTTKKAYIKIYGSSDAEGVYFGVENGYLQYYAGATWNNIMTVYHNQWYHMRVDFESGSGLYEGLSADTYHLYVDGVKKSGSGFAYKAANTGMNTLQFYTNSIGYMGFWVDAVSYSWDPNYSIGKNRQSGLLLSYTSTTTLNWKGYSLDSQANKTISGNTTLSMPVNGTHQIQVFGNDSVGTMYQSNLLYFSVNTTSGIFAQQNITIITPENKTYTEPMSLYYPGTFGFESDTVGVTPNGWTQEGGGSGTVQCAEYTHENSTHRYVMAILEYDSGQYTRNSFSATQTQGTVEFWVLFPNPQDTTKDLPRTRRTPNR
jgi:hypothetical protein